MGNQCSISHLLYCRSYIFYPARRIEDKMDAKSLTSIRFSIRMDANGHGNRRLPLLFPALFACSDAATKNVFANSKMLVTESRVCRETDVLVLSED